MNKDIIISSIIVVRNEENYISTSLKSFINQDFPKHNYEIIVVDGESTDKTIDAINETISSYKKSELPMITILNNPKKLLASGWNMAIKAAQGEFVVRIDAHSRASSNFLSKSLITIRTADSNVCCVGGRLETKSLSKEGETISKILSSPFGIGNSKFRYSDKAQITDTVAFGLYRKSLFDEVGYFDETLQRNQDNNMHGRIRNAGKLFYFNPEITCIYYSRDSFHKMNKQAYLNGKWNIITARIDHSSISIRHLVPLLFLLSLLLLIFLGFLNHIFWYLLSIEILLYILCAILFAIKKSSNILEVAKMIGLYFSLHICYGFGSLKSALTWA